MPSNWEIPALCSLVHGSQRKWPGDILTSGLHETWNSTSSIALVRVFVLQERNENKLPTWNSLDFPLLCDKEIDINFFFTDKK
jgi:hypothetical protein